MKARTYIAIDLKSFYASVECVERGLDPLKAYLVVADASRTDKTICLAVSPALKAFGIPGRPRLFEVNRAVRQINAGRPASDRVEFIVAPPQMQLFSFHLPHFIFHIPHSTFLIPHSHST